MKLTDKHISYENDCRQMFLEQTICSVIYRELKSHADEKENSRDPEPCYKTKYLDIDTLDYSIYFKMDSKTIYVFWDSTFISYGLQLTQLDFIDDINEYEQKWDVSTDNKWVDLIGQKIVSFNIIWEEVKSSNLFGMNKVYTTYPQTFEIKTENRKTIILSAAELKSDEENTIHVLMDNLLVTTNIEAAKKLKLIA